MNRFLDARKSNVVSTPRSRSVQRSWIRRLPRVVGLQLRQCWQRYRRYGRYFYRRFLSLRGSPKAIANGLACGVFAGFFPLFGLQTILGLFLASLVGGNKFAAAAGTWVSNPLTYLPIYAVNFQVGQWILGTTDGSFTRESLQNVDRLIRFPGEFLATLFVGCLVMGLLGAICSYILGLRLIYRFRRWRRVSPQEDKSLEQGDRADRLTELVKR